MSDELGEITACYTIRYERQSKHAPARLWRAITDSAEVSRWMSRSARIDLRVGGDYFVQFEPGAGALDGVIVRAEPEHNLAYVWGLSVVEWTIEPDGDGSRYSFVHHGMSVRGLPDEEGVASGWHVWLDDFERHLSGKAPDPEIGRARFEALSPPYRERLEAVLGPL